MYYVYILISLKNGRYYFGHTKDLQARVKIHNAGKVRSTKAYRPWKLHYYEEYETRSEAYKREMFFKTLEGRIWLRERGIFYKKLPRKNCGGAFEFIRLTFLFHPLLGDLLKL